MVVVTLSNRTCMSYIEWCHCHNLEWPLTQISRAHHYTGFSISAMTLSDLASFQPHAAELLISLEYCGQTCIF